MKTISDTDGAIYFAWDDDSISPWDSVSPFDVMGDIELDSPVWLCDALEELNARNFRRVNDPRVLILTEIIAL